ncbi:MAG: DHH family phosphoesterase [Sedimentisphaerales bacterium]|nr:DHH family phosphoesterase [Sedimentisphaerales bacterium]
MKVGRRTRLKVQELAEILRRSKRILIVMQDNPDPDSIAASLGLGRIGSSFGVELCTVTHRGTIGRAENRALVQYLGIPLAPCGQVDFSTYDVIALVDTQPGTGNNCLPAGCKPDVVVDHHPVRIKSRFAAMNDIRVRYGATSTILTEYLVELEISPDTPLATALLYGIRSDTQDLGREASQADIDATGFLFSFADHRMLGEIQRGSVERGYFAMLVSALENARVFGRALITSLGRIEANPDMIGEVADLLLRDEGIAWTMCTGQYGGKLLVSIRTSAGKDRADRLIRTVVSGKGTGGGHHSYAGGQASLAGKSESQCARLQRLFERRFLKAVDVKSDQWSRLVQLAHDKQ